MMCSMCWDEGDLLQQNVGRAAADFPPLYFWKLRIVRSGLVFSALNESNISRFVSASVGLTRVLARLHELSPKPID